MDTPTFPITFRTLEDGIVTLDREGGSDYSFIADCKPCGASKTGHVDTARAWANTHAGQCRAIPQPASRTAARVRTDRQT